MNIRGKANSNRLWAIAGGVNIRTKILGIVLALVLLLGAAVTLQVRATVSKTMNIQLKEQSVSTSRDLAARATDMILINDMYSLHQLLLDTEANNSNVRYAFIVTPNNQVLAHTFGDGFPQNLLAANTVETMEHHRTVILETDEGKIWDTAVPIFDGQAGVARVGISDQQLHQTVENITTQLLITTLLVSAIGITTAALLTWVLTRPILQLVRATQAVGRGDFSHRVNRWANDEIGDLADSFNNMTVQLAHAAEEHAEREQLRLRYVNGVIAAQEEERKRIARELHDSTSQTLTSLLIGLRALGDACPQPEIHARADELRNIAARTLDDVHVLALQLRPSVLDDLGLPEALERHMADCRRHYPINLDLAVNGLEERLPPNIETALYRITQEALTNIFRHAEAETASVIVEKRDDKVITIIEDDGKGFNPNQASHNNNHLGLYGIRERIELLSGTLVIESSEGHGTSLFIEIPLSPA